MVFKLQYVVIDGHLECRVCEISQPLKNFDKNSTYISGYSSMCKGCAKKDKRIRYLQRTSTLDGRSVINEKSKEWYANNLEAGRAIKRKSEYKRRAAKRATQVANISNAQILEKVKYYGNKCWVCRGPWCEIDHVKPLSKGGSHILANLRPICRHCNSSKAANWPIKVINKRRFCTNDFATYRQKERHHYL